MDDLYKTPRQKYYYVSNPFNEINEDEGTQQKALLVKSNPLYGSSNSISNPDAPKADALKVDAVNSSADETVDKNVKVKSLIKRFEPEDKRRSTRNKKEADQSDTPKLKHQRAIYKLNAAYRKYDKNLNDPEFKKYVNKLVDKGDIELNEYYDWSMEKDEWADFNKGTEF